jgi:hypothetical protein
VALAVNCRTIAEGEHCLSGASSRVCCGVRRSGFDCVCITVGASMQCSAPPKQQHECCRYRVRLAFLLAWSIGVVRLNGLEPYTVRLGVPDVVDAILSGLAACIVVRVVQLDHRFTASWTTSAGTCKSTSEVLCLFVSHHLCWQCKNAGACYAHNQGCKGISGIRYVGTMAGSADFWWQVVDASVSNPPLQQNNACTCLLVSIESGGGT